MIKQNDFFKGLNEKVVKHILNALEGSVKMEISEEVMEQLIANSTKVFRRCTADELEEFQEENEELIHWIGGLNVKEYLAVFKR